MRVITSTRCWRVVDRRQRHLERLDQLVPVAAPLVDRLEDRRRPAAELRVGEHALERGERAVVLGHDRQHFACRARARAPCRRGACASTLGQPELQRGQLLVARRAEIDAVLERLRHVVPALLLLVELLERAVGLVLAPRRTRPGCSRYASIARVGVAELLAGTAAAMSYASCLRASGSLSSSARRSSTRSSSA